MLEKNSQKILSLLTDKDRVLDIGGWSQPFNRANYVLDFMPYEGRGLHGSRGGEREYFTEKTWIQWDICDRKPFPFQDKQFEFVVCSHTLEDIRDPIWVCREMLRIAKRGYIETPSRLEESTRGTEQGGHTGYWHHRWFVEVINGELVFTAKFPFLERSWKFHFPARFRKQLNEEERFCCFFWEDSFNAKEQVFPFQAEGVSGDYESFIRRHDGRPSFRYQLLDLRRRYRNSKVREKLAPMLKVVEKPVKAILKGFV